MDSKACQKTEQGMRLQRLENLINGNEKSTQANILSAFIGFIPTKGGKCGKHPRFTDPGN